MTAKSHNISKPCIGIMAATVLCALGVALCGFSFGINARFVIVLTSCACAALEYATWRLFFCEQSVTLHSVKRFLTVLAVSTIIGLLLEWGTLFGARKVSFEAIHIDRFVCFSVIGYAVIVAIMLIRLLKCEKSINGFDGERRPDGTLIRRVLVVSLIIASVVSAIVTTLLVTVFSFTGRPVTIFIFLLALLIFPIFASGMLKKGTLPVEVLFLMMSLLFGMSMIGGSFTMPVSSWDDEIHYARAETISYGLYQEATEADLRMMRLSDEGELFLAMEPIDSTFHEDYNRELNECDDYSRTVQAEYATTVSGESVLDFWGIAYIPSAIGLWIGRLLHLPFDLVYALGKFTNLLFCSLVICLAIRIIPVKKTLLCVIALFPTSLFLTANYSYDGWIICLVILTVALFVRMLKSENLMFSPEAAVGLSTLLFVAIAPKAIYFPLFGILFMVPKNRFESSEKHREYILIIVLFVLLAIASFLLPFVATSGANKSDLRGGNNVNAGEQAIFVLSHPLQYASVLGRFLVTEYLNPINANDYICNLGVFSIKTPTRALWAIIPFATMVGSAILAQPVFNSDKRRVKNAVWVLFLFVCTVILIVSSLYVSFTPVADTTILGCQGRYLLPLIPATFMFFLDLDIKIRKSRTWLSFIAIGVSVLFLGRFVSCVMIIFN